jgi:hypothetical protein
MLEIQASNWGMIKHCENRTGALLLPSRNNNGDAKILSHRVVDVVGNGEDSDDAAVVVEESTLHHTINLQGKPIAKDARAEMIQKWGTWTWQDKKDVQALTFTNNIQIAMFHGPTFHPLPGKKIHYTFLVCYKNPKSWS